MYQNTQPSKKPVLIGAAAVALLVGAATYSMQSAEAPEAIEMWEGLNDYDLTDLEMDPFSTAGVTATANWSIKPGGGGFSMQAKATVTVEQKVAKTAACGKCQPGGYEPVGMNAEQFREAHAMALSNVQKGVDTIYTQNTNTLNSRRSSEAIQWLQEYNAFY